MTVTAEPLTAFSTALNGAATAVFIPPPVFPMIWGSKRRVVKVGPPLPVDVRAVKLACRRGLRTAGGATLCTGLNPRESVSLGGGGAVAAAVFVPAESLIGVEVRNLLGCDSLAKNLAVLLM